MAPQSRPATTIGAADRGPSVPAGAPYAAICSGRLRVVVDAGGPARSDTSRDDVHAAQGQAGADRDGARARPSVATTVTVVVGLVADQSAWRRRRGAAPAPRRPLRRPRAGGDSRATSVATRRSAACSSARRSHLGPRLGVRDRRRHQLREVRRARVSVSAGSGRSSLRGGDHHAPQAARRRRSGADRRADARASACSRRDRAGGVRVAVYPGRRAASATPAPTTLSPSSGHAVPTRKPSPSAAPGGRRASTVPSAS